MSSLTTQTTTIDLTANWKFRDVRPEGSWTTALAWLPARVPGHVHVDLVNAGVIADPFERLGERGAQWVDETDWLYETTFHLGEEPTARTLLVFEGLDTVADIDLNGTRLGRVDNMFIPHEFEVSQHLKFGEDSDGDNTLTITFHAARRVGRERIAEWNKATGPEDSWDRWTTLSFVRKAQYMYGWDWGPELASCGIWRPVKLVHIPTARLLDYSVDTKFNEDNTATVTLDVYVDRAVESGPLSLSIDFTRAGNEAEALDVKLPAKVTVDVPAGQGRVLATATVTIDDPQVWWPNRHNPAGAGIHPTLYTVDLALTSAGQPVDARTVKIGLRTIELIREPDDIGESFKFRVNGHDIFIKGANWIPTDSFPSRLENDGGKLDSPSLFQGEGRGEVSNSPSPFQGEGRGEVVDLVDERVYNLLWDCCDAGFNMLRVWGGGLYESDHFYELCDEHGILVWQDFTYACAYYPDTGEYAEASHVEAVAAVRRLRGHASLALWCGNNENQMMFDQKWGGSAPARHLGEKLYNDILPSVVAAENPSTPYWPGSPYGGELANSPDAGDRHNWDVWHGVGDWTHYAEDTSRFASEFGFAASCSLAAWDTCLGDIDRTAYSPAVRWHDKTRKGYETYLNLVKIHYPEMSTIEDLVYYTQLNQADALKFGIEHYRRLKGRCWGTLIWQINDCWPVQSWAMIDSELQHKAAFYASRSFYAPVLLSLKRVGDTVEAHVVNDALGPVQGKIAIALKTFDGETLAESTFDDVFVHCNDKSMPGSVDISAVAGRENSTYVTASLTGPDGDVISRNLLLLGEPKELALSSPELSIDFAEHDDDTIAVTISATSFAASVWLYVDPEDAPDPPEFSDNFFHLEAGETRTSFIPKTDAIPSAEDLRELLRVRTLYGEE